MRNKIEVSIGGKNYTMVAVEDEDYVRRCAALVDKQLQEVMSGSRLPQVDAAVLAAMNVADLYLKEQEVSENLRRQVKECLEESAKLKLELSEAKREIFKLQNRKPQNRPQGPKPQNQGGRSQNPPQPAEPDKPQERTPDKPQAAEPDGPQAQPASPAAPGREGEEA